MAILYNRTVHTLLQSPQEMFVRKDKKVELKSYSLPLAIEARLGETAMGEEDDL